MLEDRERDVSAPAPSAAGATVGPALRDPTGHTDLSGGHTAVFPSPLSTAIAVVLGAAIGFATVYGLAAQRVDPVFGVVVIVALFGASLLGQKQLTDARTEWGRAVAVALNGLAIGGTLGGATVLI